jgi:hypothetical protein
MSSMTSLGLGVKIAARQIKARGLFISIPAPDLLPLDRTPESNDGGNQWGS